MSGSSQVESSCSSTRLKFHPHPPRPVNCVVCGNYRNCIMVILCKPNFSFHRCFLLWFCCWKLVFQFSLWGTASRRLPKKAAKVQEPWPKTFAQRNDRNRLGRLLLSYVHIYQDREERNEMCTFVNMQIDLAIGIDFTNMYIRLFTLPFNLPSQAKQKYKKLQKILGCIF